MLAFVEPTIAQEAGWLHAGAGLSSTGLCVGLGGAVETGKLIVSFRSTYAEELQLIGHHYATPNDSAWDVGTLLGIRTIVSDVFFSAAAGLGIVGGVQRGRYLRGWLLGEQEYEPETFCSLGIPMEIRISTRPWSFLGVGMYGFANVNSTRSFAGVLLSVQVGKLE